MASEEDLSAAIYGVYEAGLRLKPPYRATRFLQMLDGPGGPLAAAHELLVGPAERIHDGFSALVFDHGRPDITLEWVALRPEFRRFFAREELEVAHRRLLLGAPDWMNEHMPILQ